MWIARDLNRELLSIADSFPVVVVVGPRQVGKTALLERTFSGSTYVALDVAGHAEMAETRPEEFLRRFPPPLILDEIQYAPALFRHVKTTVDQRRGENGLFVLSGSQDFVLMQSVSESLAGRASVVPLASLSGREWQGAGFDREHTWRDFLWRGGYPALWAEGEASPSRDRWYQGYLATYLERDVRNLLDVGNLRDFERFLRAAASRTARTLNMSELGRDIGVSTPTVKAWLSVLQASGQILLLEPYYRSLGKRLAKSPKLYFTDTGLAAFLMGFGSAEALWQSPDAGPLFENFVVGQWLRWKGWQQPSATLWFWRDQHGNEVDLVIEWNGQLHAIECRLAEAPRIRDLRGLEKLAGFYGEAMIGGRYVACTTPLPHEIGDRVTALPGWSTWPLPYGQGA
ncbi:MAG: ATP-binding protein [Holophagales bacterium]|nr:ATP-binding protein [Holophagales bacterium]